MDKDGSVFDTLPTNMHIIIFMPICFQ